MAAENELIILGAGAFMNFILAIVLFTAIGFYLLLTIDSEKPLPFSE